LKFVDELKKLNLPSNQFAVFGSGPLAVRGLRKANDIDIVVKGELWEILCSKYFRENSGMIQVGNIEIGHAWPPFTDVNELIDDADVFDGVRFVKLKKVLEWKRFRYKEKDVRDIALIEEYFASQ
jgi:hypothetical protein